MIYFILGTKAQLIKVAPIMHQLKIRKIEYKYISTAQHKDTMDEIHKNFQIKKPDFTIFYGKDVVTTKDMFFWSIKCLYNLIKHYQDIFKSNKKNSIILVHGDTSSTVLGALIGKVAKIKVGHIESGLFSHNIFQPFPEELFRRITFSLSNYYFCPGEFAMNNLNSYSGIKVNTYNNTLYDSLILSLKSNKEYSRLNIPNYDYGIVSLHRYENFKNKNNAKKIISLINYISMKKKLIFIIHKSTEKKLKEFKLLKEITTNPNIEVRQRYPYFDFIKLLKNSQFLVSDGGSNQEECYYLGKPILLFRNVTERNEGLNKNALLSKLKKKNIDLFFQKINQQNFNFIKLNQSPSDIIINNLKPFYL